MAVYETTVHAIVRFRAEEHEVQEVLDTMEETAMDSLEFLDQVEVQYIDIEKPEEVAQ